MYYSFGQSLMLTVTVGFNTFYVFFLSPQTMRDKRSLKGEKINFERDGHVSIEIVD